MTNVNNVSNYIDSMQAYRSVSIINTELVKSNAERYTSTLIFVGYVGFITIWSQLWNKIPSWSLKISSALMLISGTIYIFMEIYSILTGFGKTSKRQLVLKEMGQALDNKDSKKVYAKAMEYDCLLEVRLGGCWKISFWSSILTRFGGALTLVVGIIISI
ncbi:hypothetical protein [Maridesulfovibrio ferrireducens]|uniref:hypothetical protein n=1 Tax=Maridesulfovibrio ferrireducens TaxID=246191 RepID=UPI001A18E286|nr:hypothetical protein [Maridesulfovibrio ferrireducens]MBI9112735.1 hypothetical protein [Maridesulfovibrio ferrireducens]